MLGIVKLGLPSAMMMVQTAKITASTEHMPTCTAVYIYQRETHLSRYTCGTRG